MAVLGAEIRAAQAKLVNLKSHCDGAGERFNTFPEECDVSTAREVMAMQTLQAA